MFIYVVVGTTDFVKHLTLYNNKNNNTKIYNIYIVKH